MYIIAKKEGSDRRVVAHEATKVAADAYDSGTYEYYHWVPKFMGGGYPPIKSTPAADHHKDIWDTLTQPKKDAITAEDHFDFTAKTYDQYRESAYFLETDGLAAAVRNQIQRGEIADEPASWAAWEAAVTAIKAKYPKPE